MQAMEAQATSFTAKPQDSIHGDAPSLFSDEKPAALPTKQDDSTIKEAPFLPLVSSPLFSGSAGAVSLAHTVSQPLEVSSNGIERKKRGRPKKYGPDGFPLPLSATSVSAAAAKQAAKSRLLSSLGEWFAYSAGGNFTPHIVTIGTGEDVATKIQSLAQKGPRAICVLSAIGAISNATLRQPGSSGGTLTYEGRFEILSLSGSFTSSKETGKKSRTGGISVSLAGPDGRVIGGGVAGLLLAASPIQVVVGSFLPNTFNKELKRKAHSEATVSSPLTPSGVLTSARPISQATPDDDSETPTPNFPVRSQGNADTSTNIETVNSSTYRAPGWHGFQPPEHRPSPDINICLQGE